jgi:hypothetical protein
MYYDEDAVDCELQCPLCSQMLEDPRVLPCGNICCLKCIRGQFNITNNYKCKCCESIHEKKEDDEYPISKLAKNLLEKAKTKISSKFIQLNFKQELNKFKAAINSLDEKQRNYKSNLSDYCQLVRSQIVLRTDSIIIDLHKHCDEMFKTIDHYESEKIKEWDNENEEYRTNLTTLINDNNLIQKNMMELYKNQNIETTQIKDAVELMKHNSIKIINTNIEISNKVFNLKYLQNEDEIGIGSIGEIFKVEKLDLVIQLNASIFDSSVGSNGKYLSVFYHQNDTPEIYDNYLLVKHNTKFSAYNKIDCYYLFNDYMIFLILNVIFIHKYDLASNEFVCHLHKIFQNFGRSIIICADNESIFIMNDDYEVCCFNWNSEKVKKIGQIEDVNQSFQKVFQMDIRNKRFYLRKSNKIEILDEKDVTLLKTIEINSYKFTIDDNNKHLIVFCNDSINRYQLKSGEFISQIDTTGFIPNGFKFHDYDGEKYILLSKNKKELYSIKI